MFRHFLALVLMTAVGISLADDGKKLSEEEYRALIEGRDTLFEQVMKKGRENIESGYGDVQGRSENELSEMVKNNYANWMKIQYEAALYVLERTEDQPKDQIASAKKKIESSLETVMQNSKSEGVAKKLEKKSEYEKKSDLGKLEDLVKGLETAKMNQPKLTPVDGELYSKEIEKFKKEITDRADRLKEFRELIGDRKCHLKISVKTGVPGEDDLKETKEFSKADIEGDQELIYFQESKKYSFFIPMSKRTKKNQSKTSASIFITFYKPKAETKMDVGIELRESFVGEYDENSNEPKPITQFVMAAEGKRLEEMRLVGFGTANRYEIDCL